MPPVSLDVPVVVVQDHVVASAKEYAVGDVGFAVVLLPVINMVRFSPGGGSVAVWPDTTAVTDPDADALFLGEESLFASDVDALPVIIESDAHRSGVTQVSLNGFPRHRVGVAFQMPVTGPIIKDRLGHDHTHGGSAATEYPAGVGLTSYTE